MVSRVLGGLVRRLIVMVAEMSGVVVFCSLSADIVDTLLYLPMDTYLDGILDSFLSRYVQVNLEIPSKWISFSTNRTSVDLYQEPTYHLYVSWRDYDSTNKSRPISMIPCFFQDISDGILYGIFVMEYSIGDLARSRQEPL